eukprot:TRINITY_DN42257_c0_g1_i1.p1 TRINITY_DN42257_c0_g1~~TRINITY_DN42257_c0_g1_i1.p1  ORF type:complete len:419 (+),score=51.02 TRINITY_DN42257_c0_g1_i1:29-1258(+)
MSEEIPAPSHLELENVPVRLPEAAHELHSLVGTTGEWETRPVALTRIFAGIASQLREGQDLTKISLPAALCYPFSALEISAYQSLGPSELLVSAACQPTPELRLRGVTQWFLAMLQQQHIFRKPYNPVLCETHQAFVKHAEGSSTHFLTEQVSHHPPVAALHIENTEAGVEAEVHMQMVPKWTGGGLSIGCKGSGWHIRLRNSHETVTISTGLPDMRMCNMFFGTRRVEWTGNVTITLKPDRPSPETNATGASAELESDIELRSDSSQSEGISSVNSLPGDEYVARLRLDANKVTGHVCGLPLRGKIGGSIALGAEVPWLNFGSVERCKIQYPSVERILPTDSLLMWRDCSRAIAALDLAAAEQAKTLVEVNQRQLRKSGEIKSPHWFGWDTAQQRWCRTKIPPNADSH